MMSLHETGAALDSVVATGKVASVGVSNFKRDNWTLLQSIMKTPLATNQIEISVVENSAFTNGDLVFCRNLVCRPWFVPAGWLRIVPGGEPQASDFVSNDWCS